MGNNSIIRIVCFGLLSIAIFGLLSCVANKQDIPNEYQPMGKEEPLLVNINQNDSNIIQVKERLYFSHSGDFWVSFSWENDQSDGLNIPKKTKAYVKLSSNDKTISDVLFDYPEGSYASGAAKKLIYVSPLQINKPVILHAKIEVGESSTEDFGHGNIVVYHKKFHILN